MSDPQPLITVQRGELRYGPYPVSEVQALLQQSRLQLGDLAWHEGMAHPEPLGAILQRLGITPSSAPADGTLKWIVPVGRSPWAIAAGYAGLFSVLIFPGPIALACGLLALRDIKRHPGLEGRGRAWFGIVMGALGTALVLAFLIAAAVG